MRSIHRVLPLLALCLLVQCLLTSPAAAQDPESSLNLMGEVVKPMVLAVVFTVTGLLLFALCIWLIVKVTPFSIRKEIEEDQNVALGLIVGSMILGIAIILAAALLG